MPRPDVTAATALEPLLHRLYATMFEGEPPPLLDLLDEPWVAQSLCWLGVWQKEPEEGL